MRSRMSFKSVVLTLSLCLSAVSAQGQDIVDTAVGAGQFNTLVAAVKAAGLVDALKGPGPFTVFAPTDDRSSPTMWFPAKWRPKMLMACSKQNH